MTCVELMLISAACGAAAVAAVVEALLAAGADKDATSSPLCSHRTALCIAIREGRHPAVLQALLAAGAEM